MTQETSKIEELRARAKDVSLKRAKKLQEYKDSVETVRLQNEILLGEIEERTGLTLGKDLGVVWLRCGEMIVVQKPQQLVFEAHQLKVTNGKLEAKDLDRLLSAPALIHPDPTKLEVYAELEPEAKFAAAELACQLCAVAQKDLGGKS